ncbi:MAG: hypothetical protein LBD54_01870 [Puniceicoccales bacterium]|jgi:hypothetical protein|nr:hypothetical protein [Puniceicoccales bacterium]
MEDMTSGSAANSLAAGSPAGEKEGAKEELSDFQKSLEAIQFAPEWTQRPERREYRASEPSGDPGSHRPKASFPPPKDRRPRFERNREAERPRPPFDRREKSPGYRSDSGYRGESSFRGDSGYRGEPGYRGEFRGNWENRSTWEKPREVFDPIVDAAFYPEDKAFDLLVSTLRSSGKTHELFHLVQLILEKPERFVVVIRRRPESHGEVLPLYLSLLDNLPFESEKETLNHILQQHLDEFFSIENLEVDPPKGKFSCVHRCGLTKKLLAAPNDHRYREILREHFQNEIRDLSYENFCSRIETTQEEADIQAWIEQMSHRKVYIPRELPEGATEPVRLECLSDVRQYCLEHFRERLIRSSSSLRVTGSALARLPSRRIRRSIELLWQQQRRFPWETANNLRGRLRRAHFWLYRKKVGEKLITFTCAVKRKIRTGQEVFEPEIQSVLTWLEAHPMSTRQELAAEGMPQAVQQLSWLIQAGFVTEFEDGRLFLPKVMPEPVRKAAPEKNTARSTPQETDLGEILDEGLSAESPEEEVESSIPQEFLGENAETPVPQEADSGGIGDEGPLAEEDESTAASEPASDEPDEAAALESTAAEPASPELARGVPASTTLVVPAPTELSIPEKVPTELSVPEESFTELSVPEEAPTALALPLEAVESEEEKES